MKTRRSFLMLTAAAVLLGACSSSDSAKTSEGPRGTARPKSPVTAEPSQASPATGPVSVTSTAFAEGADIPVKFSCDGGDVSPPLTWSPLPKGTKDVLVTVTDPDADGFVHWALWGLDPESDGLAEGEVPSGARQARNDFGKNAYGGPCPPPGGAHRYVFTVRALAEPLGLDNGASPKDAEEKAAPVTLGEGSLTAKFAH